MKQVLIRKGEVAVEETPAPKVSAGQVLVAVDTSCISAGTEMSGVQSSGKSLLRRAVTEPHNVAKGMALLATQGVRRTKQIVQGELAVGRATGYSAAGTIIEVGVGVEDYTVGQRVACAGAGYANHAEIISVPENLVAPIPDELGFDAASTTTLGAIALQGVRRANPTLGETFVVVGLGILGQMVARILKANGCHVIGTDLAEDRIDQAMEAGMDDAVREDLIRAVELRTDGHGADGVIVTAATKSNEPLANAFKMCRRKGRVVVVGDVGLEINRRDIYAKELDFHISCSYGPGRYDSSYEEDGNDYPIGYVRWTENRNMRAYLQMLASGQVSIDDMLTTTYSIDEAAEGFAALRSEDRPLMVLLKHGGEKGKRESLIRLRSPVPARKRIRVGIIGAGKFAKSTHIPNVQQMASTFDLHAIMSRSSATAHELARVKGCAVATTDASEIFKDDDTDAVIITTRHHDHAQLTLQALQAGKHVLVEKPLAIDREGMAPIQAFLESEETPPVLLTGFNRRFSPHVTWLQDQLGAGPKIMDYSMNAGYIPANSWVHGVQGGGRNIGEACHIYDLFTALADSPVDSVVANAVRTPDSTYGPTDNFHAAIRFDNGDLANLTYTAMGSKAHPKERMNIYNDGSVLHLDDYKLSTATKSKVRPFESNLTRKGHLEELQAFGQAIAGGTGSPIPLWQQFQAMDIAFQVNEQLLD